MFVADDAVEQPFVGGSAQFFKRTEIHRGEVAARTTTDGRLYALSVGLTGEPPPDAGCVLQFGDDDRPVDDLQCGIIHAVCAQDDDGPNVQTRLGC